MDNLYLHFGRVRMLNAQPDRCRFLSLSSFLSLCSEFVHSGCGQSRA